MTAKTKFLNFFRNIFRLRLLEILLRSLTQGKTVNSFWPKFVPNNYQYQPGTMRSFISNGIKLKTDISDYLGHYVYFGFRDNSLDQLFKLCKAGNTVLDIGANIGFTTLKFATVVGEHGRVLGFEPDFNNFKTYSSNIASNEFKNVKAFNFGLGNENSSFKLFEDTPSNRGMNRILTEELGNDKKFCVVQIFRLDDWLRSQKIDHIDLIKIDVEGYELKILQGAEESLKKIKPKLFVELDDNNLKQQGQSATELIFFLEKTGYHPFNAETMKPVSSSDNFKNCHFDIICNPSNTN